MSAALMLACVLAAQHAPAAATSRPAKHPKVVEAPKVPPKPVVALLELKGLVADEERAALDEQLRAALPAFDLDVQPKPRTEQAQKDLRGLGLCADAGSVDCLVQIGALSKARVVLAGVLSPRDGGTDLEILGVDVNGMKERGRVKVLVPSGDPAARALAVESALVGVLRPEVWQGSVRVSVAQRGASIYVDGAARGFAPLSEAIELTPGSHALFVSLEGFTAFKANVDVSYKSETAVDVVLVPGETEPPPHLASATAPTPEPAVAPVRKAPLRVVVYDIDAVGVDKRVAHVMNELIVAEIRKHERASVLDSSELTALVGDNEKKAAVDTRGCSTTECFAEVADALGADAVVVATLTNIEGQILFGLRRVDPHKQEVASSFLDRVPAADTGALLPLVGKSVGVTFADVPLRAGQHAGVDERAEKVMNPPPLPPILAGSLYAGAGVAAAASTALFVTAGVAWLSYGGTANAAALPQQRKDENPDEMSDIAPWGTAYAIAAPTAIVSLCAAAVLGVAAVSTGAFTDWDGDGAPTARAP